MMLLVQLMSGDTAVSLDVADHETVWVLLAQARRMLRKNVRWLVSAAGVRLQTSATLSEAGLIEGERLTAVVGPRQEPVVLDAGDEIADVAYVRTAVAQADGFCSLLVLPRRGVVDYDLPTWAWSELLCVDELEIRCCIESPQMQGLAEGLRELEHLRKLELTVRLGPAGDELRGLMNGLTCHLEELRITWHNYHVNADPLVCGLQHLRRLRVLALRGRVRYWSCEAWRQLFDALPECLEELAIPLAREGPATQFPGLPPSLRSFRVSVPEDFHTGKSLQAAGWPGLFVDLPASLQELHLPHLRLCCDASWLGVGLRRLAAVRKVSLPTCDDSELLRAMLQALPEQLEELHLWVPQRSSDLEAVQEWLPRLQQLKKATFYNTAALCQKDPDTTATCEHPRVWDALLLTLPKGLEALVLSDCGLSKEAASAAAAHLPHFSRLRHVDLSGNASGFSPLMCGLPTSLTSLRLDAWDFVGVDEAVLRTALSAEQLRNLRQAELLLRQPVFPDQRREWERSFKLLFR